MSPHSSEVKKSRNFNPITRKETKYASEIFKTWCAKTIQDMSFSNFMNFSFSAFGLISTAFLQKFPLMQHAVIRTERKKSLQGRAFFIAGNNLHRNGDTSSYGKMKRSLQKSDR